MTNLEKKIVQILKADSRYSHKEIADMLGEPVENVTKIISQLEDTGVIVKYTTIINTEKTGEEFIDALIAYINYVHEYIRDIYVDYREVFENFKSILIERFKDKSKSKNLLTTVVLNRIVTDGIERKQIIILSLIRLEYCWTEYNEKKIYHIRGLFFWQRILHSSSFTIF